MNEDRLQGRHQSKIRLGLRIGGPMIGFLGLIFAIIGFGSFFSSFSSGEMPHYFWCVFIGLPLIFVGGATSMIGFMGTFYRYTAGEIAPVAKDVVNYMGVNTAPGVKAVAKAIAEGVFEAQREQPRPGH